MPNMLYKLHVNTENASQLRYLLSNIDADRGSDCLKNWGFQKLGTHGAKLSPKSTWSSPGLVHRLNRNGESIEMARRSHDVEVVASLLLVAMPFAKPFPPHCY